MMRNLEEHIAKSKAEPEPVDEDLFKDESELKPKRKQKPKLKPSSKEDPLDDLDAEIDLSMFNTKDEE